MARHPPKAPATLDPIEAVKVAAPPLAPPKPVAPPAPSPSPVQAPVTSPQPSQAPQQAPSAPPKERRAKVLKAKKLSLRGHFTTLPAGTIVGESSYGKGIIERLLDAKVELEILD